MLPLTVSFPLTVNKSEFNGTKAPKVMDLQGKLSEDATVGGLVNDKIKPIFTSSVDAGTPEGDQLPGVFQFDTAPTVPPTQFFVPATAKVVCKTSSNSGMPTYTINFFITQQLSSILFLLVVGIIHESTCYYVYFIIAAAFLEIMNKLNNGVYFI
ncbi:hypothetical protein GCM10022210_23520 [Mucilaginibacter dorajii]|uniref:Uncharacterized protein n=1 Tax=Mucilaginibacter dorajii TaxID=692994 RepID=A0ABP7PXQ0_9SPHI